MQDKHVMFVVVSEPIVVHVVPQELEGLGLFSILKEKGGVGRWKGEITVSEVGGVSSHQGSKGYRCTQSQRP